MGSYFAIKNVLNIGAEVSEDAATGLYNALRLLLIKSA